MIVQIHQYIQYCILYNICSISTQKCIMLGLQVNINYKWHIIMHIILMQQHYNAHPKPSPTTNEANGKVLTDFKKRIKVFISKKMSEPPKYPSF